MPTTIRVEDDVKQELDSLQGDFLAEGQRLSHSELLARLLRFARLHEDLVLGKVEPTPPSRADVDRFLGRVPDVRVRTRVRDLDDALYGSRP